MMLGAIAPIGTDDVPGASTLPPTQPTSLPPDDKGIKKYIPLIVAAVVLYYILNSKN